MGRDEVKRRGGELPSFQFTRPAWGATRQGRRAVADDRFQFTRPAWGATSASERASQMPEVSIHAPRMGRDRVCVRIVQAVPGFQFTRPAWGATPVSTASHTRP